MVSVPPAPPPSGPMAPGALSFTITVALSTESQKQIQTLSHGTHIKAIVTHTSAQGELVIDTPYGEIKGELRPPYPLEKGTRLLVEISRQSTTKSADISQERGRQATFLLKILSIEKTNSPVPITAARTLPDISGSMGLSPSGVTPSPGIYAHILTPAEQKSFEGPHKNQSPNETSLPPGARLIIRVVASSPPQQQAAPNISPSPIHPSGFSTLLSPTQLATSHEGFEKSQISNTFQTIPAPLRLQGTIGVNTYLGASVVHTPLGTFVLDRFMAIPPGHQVTLDVTHISPPPPTQTTLAQGVGQTATTATWPSMQTLLSTLSTPSDINALGLLLRSLPSLGSGLDGRFVAAAQSMIASHAHPTQKTWPGRTLRTAIEHLNARTQRAFYDVIQDIRASTRPATDGGPDWKMYHLPLYLGHTIEKIMIITRRVPHENDHENGGAEKRNLTSGTRFLFNFTLSRLGPMQIDGLYQQAHRQLNLIIKSKIALESLLRQDLLALFHQSTQALGVKGDLIFRTLPTLSQTFDDIDPPPHRDTDVLV